MIYVLQVTPQKEQDAKDGLSRVGYKNIYIPEELRQLRRRGKWIEEKRKLFSGYVFLDLKEEMRPVDYFYIKRLDYVIRLLGLVKHNALPLPLPPEEAELILWCANSDNPIEPSTAEVGQEIRIVSGILKGKEGSIKKINRRQRRCTIEIKTLDITHTVDLSLNFVKTLV